MMKQNFKIRSSDVSVGPLIGKGGFGEVYKGMYEGDAVAIKVLICPNLTNESKEEFLNELEVMVGLRSGKLINVYGGIIEEHQTAIVMELMPRGSVFDMLHNNPEEMTWPIKYKISLDIAYGLKHLHERHIIHRDLKSMNVLLDDKLNAKICDFGLAKVKIQSQSTATMGGSAGTILWMAPELFGMRVKNTEKSDVYALGMVLYELLTHKLPFADFLEGKKAEYVVPVWLKDGERPEIPSYGDRIFKDLIEQCWHQDSGTRPTAEQVAKRLEQMTTNEPSQAAAGGGPKVDLKEASLPLSTTQIGASSVEAISHGIAQLPLSTKDINPIPSSVFVPPAKPAPVIPAIDQGQVNKLLDHVMRGEQNEAENMIKANPQLLNHKGAGKEFHNGREFKSITPFQYALWALDWYMWDMMMKHIDHSQARSQLEELESRGTEHGKQFNGFDRLINAYQDYLDKYDDWCSKQRKKEQKQWIRKSLGFDITIVNFDHLTQHWCKVVGGAQKDLPIHALQEYWRTDRSMSPTPDFKGKRGKKHGDLVEDVANIDFAVSWAVTRAWVRAAFRAKNRGGSYLRIRATPVEHAEAGQDRSGIVSLKDTRNSQYKELRETLSKAPGLRIR